jgi:multicomponent Na+:H+ antiporter subunit D
MATIEQLAIFQITIPLIVAPLVFLLKNGNRAWFLTLVTSVAMMWVASQLLVHVLSVGEFVTQIGGWAAPWGIEYRVDTVNAFVLLIVSGMSSIVLMFARQSVNQEIESNKRSLFYTSWLLCLTGLLGVTITGDAFNVFVFLEISSLSSYVLIAMGRDRRALTSSFQYLVMGTIGATFILIGIGFLFIVTGTLNMADISERLSDTSQTRTVRTAFAFIIVGIGLKLAMFPLHLWLPNAYAYAPSVASAFLAATATKVALYMLLRFIYTVFGFEFSFDLPLSETLVILSSAAILVGSVVAIFQDNLKRLLAYSSVAQIGYMLLGVSLATQAGLSAALLHVFNHAVIKGGLFLVLGCFVFRFGTASLKLLSGKGTQMPWTFAAFIAGGLSLIGVPLTTGFVSKWQLVTAALDIGWWPVALVVLAGSILAIVYVWRAVEVLYFRPVSDDSQIVKEAPLELLLPTWLLIGANIYFGINTELSIGVADVAAHWLMTGTR